MSIFPKRLTQGHITPGNVDLYAANGSRIRCFGFQELQIDISLPEPVYHRFVICNVSFPILGADFITGNRLSVSYTHLTLPTNREV